MPTISQEELNANLISMPDWRSDGGRISKTYRFDTYMEGLVFAVACGRLAEKRDHHPDMTIGHKSVEISLSTHSEGGVTPKDLHLAQEFDGLI